MLHTLDQRIFLIHSIIQSVCHSFSMQKRVYLGLRKIDTFEDLDELFLSINSIFLNLSLRREDSKILLIFGLNSVNFLRI